MLFEGLKEGRVADSWTIYSIGGGALANETSRLEVPASVYPMSTISGDPAVVRPRRQDLLGVCERLRRSRNLGLPRPDMDRDVRNHPAGT